MIRVRVFQRPIGNAHAALSVAALLVASGNDSRAQGVDTSEWVCERCPFEEGHRADYTVGASSISEDSAYFNDASGYGEEGIVANADADGAYTSERHRLNWSVTDFGLDSRSAELRGGRPGRFDYTLVYRELPRRQFITTESIFAEQATLALPAGWVAAGTTGGLTQLSSSLSRRDIESDRLSAGIGASFEPWPGLEFSAGYRRQEQDGVDVLGGAYFTTASILPMPFDYVTDDVNLGVRYAARRGFVALNWHLSDFESAGNAFGWESPFTTAPGAEFAQIAQPPDNEFSRVALSGGYRFDAGRTLVKFSASFGQIQQDEAFLPYTANATLTTAALPRSRLNGEVGTNSVALSLNTQPFRKLRLRLSYRQDERDNDTPQEVWNRVITDTFTSGEAEINIPYSYERATFRARADYDLLEAVRLSAGYERREIDRDFQEVAEQTEDDGWGRVRWRPTALVEVDLRGGTAKRDIDRYNEAVAATFGQNPLLRKYNLAYRYREYGELRLNASLPETPVSLSLTAFAADDSYTQSQLGITSADDRRVAADFNWSIAESASLYVHAGVETIEGTQLGSESFGAEDWRARNEDRFETVGGGIRVRQITDKVDLSLDYLRSNGATELEVDADSGSQSRFPNLDTTLDDLRLKLSYRRSDRLEITAGVRWQRFEAEDWALAGVSPNTIPTVLSLGADPYDDEVIIVGLSFRYTISSRLAAGEN